ncbi:MAG: hypothetical protein COB29_13260 [Sulfitobacter sp.]|nr:MAG: hypothetical protein COB29_13260 [Sulfitobacter sp.]
MQRVFIHTIEGNQLFCHERYFHPENMPEVVRQFIDQVSTAYLAEDDKGNAIYPTKDAIQ